MRRRSRIGRSLGCAVLCYGGMRVLGWSVVSALWIAFSAFVISQAAAAEKADTHLGDH